MKAWTQFDRPEGNVYVVRDDGGSPLEDLSERPAIVAPTEIEKEDAMAHSTESDQPRTCPTCHGPRHMAGSFTPPIDPQRWWCNPDCTEWGALVSPPGTTP